jgi:hypothetical protein
MTGEGATAGGLTRLGLVNRMVPVEQFDAGAEASCGGCDRTEGPPDGSQREGRERRHFLRGALFDCSAASPASRPPAMTFQHWAAISAGSGSFPGRYHW